MKSKHLFLLILFLQTVVYGYAQVSKNTTHINQAWFAYFNQTRLSNKWGIWADIQLRTKEDFVNNLSQSLNRAGITYYLTDNTKLTFGYAFINHFPGDNHANISQPEHRIWQQVQWHNKYPRLRMMQWFRLEEKFRHKIADNSHLAEGYNYNWKLRYNFLFNVPLNKKAFAPGTFSFVLNDEVHVNFGKEIVYNYFDQNRFFIGFSYHTNAADNLQFGYMNLFQQLATGNSYKNIHTARISYFHNLDLRKK
jgi:competence CoiA-like predicted nuclease